MAGRVRRRAISTRHAAEGVAVDAIGADLLEQAGNRLRHAERLGPRARFPRHGGKKHAHAVAMEVRDHVFERRESSRHVSQHVELVAVVDADVGIDRPQQHAVDPAVALLEVFEKAVHGVAPGGRIVEIAVLDHRLRLDEAALRPLQLGPFVDVAAQAGADAALGAILPHLLQPFGGVGFGGRPGELLPLRRVLGVLSQKQSGDGEGNGGQPRDAHGRSSFGQSTKTRRRLKSPRPA